MQHSEVEFEILLDFMLPETVYIVKFSKDLSKFLDSDPARRPT